MPARRLRSPLRGKRPTRLFTRLAAGSVGYFTERRLARAVKRRTVTRKD